MMSFEEFKRRLSSCTKSNIIISPHARIRAEQRGISEKEIIDNITNPVRLIVFRFDTKEKYDCWFEYSKNLGHHYTIILNGNAIVVTVIKIRRRWQRRVEKYVKKIQG